MIINKYLIYFRLANLAIYTVRSEDILIFLFSFIKY
jgi:hypothetical protein